MEFTNLIPAEFVWRVTRFTANIRVGGKLSQAHVANTGRLPGIFQPGRRVWLKKAQNPNRRTRFDIKLVDCGGVLVSIDTRIPNTLFEEAVRNNRLKEYIYDDVKREVQLGKSRIDFRLSSVEDICWVETKSVTLVEDGIAMFPDAPTARGRRHLLELAAVLSNGVRSSAVFIVQRSDAVSFTPNWSVDHEFSKTLVEVHSAGVEVKAYRCDVNIGAISIVDEIPVNLTHHK